MNGYLCFAPLRPMHVFLHSVLHNDGKADKTIGRIDYGADQNEVLIITHGFCSCVTVRCAYMVAVAGRRGRRRGLGGRARSCAQRCSGTSTCAREPVRVRPMCAPTICHIDTITKCIAFPWDTPGFELIPLISSHRTPLLRI